MPSPQPPFGRELELLAGAELGIIGRVAESSNLTFAVELRDGDDYAWAIYKPMAGERELWDFEPGLHARERAAFLLSEWLGWHLVPPTVVRADGPAGIGSLQWYIEADAEHYFTLIAGHPESHDQLLRIAVFDLVTNNTDRKSGHVLRDAEGRLWAIDHGLCFAAEPKLRTVIWDFAGEVVDDDLLADLRPLANSVPCEVAELLTLREVEMLRRRVQQLLDRPVLPTETSPYQYPWPLV
ncbi:MAG: SCO1664 family protein [Brooklawnia sp.]|uniref:SCO1664 family protein n=1 Tax=Brooklawnia sp. TaxID=2699740 RepID=UPI003C71EB2A